MTTKKEWAIGIVGGLALVFILMLLPFEMIGPAIVVVICAGVFWNAHNSKRKKATPP